MDLIESVISHVLRADDGSLDEKTREIVKTLVIDTMGVAAAGSRGPGIPELAGLIRGWGGKPEASTLVFGDKVPAFHAALVNGASARAWDFDDVHEGGGGHICASIIPTAFVLAQYSGRKISGKTLMLAIALGTDLGCRLRQALHYRSGWIADTFAPFGVVAAASRILGFDEKMTRAAMGLAYAQCSSNGQGSIDGALSVRLQQGLAAKSGVLAAQFAEIGFFGPKNILQGQLGLYPLFARNEYNPEAITDELGQRFEIINTSLKPYPTCKLTHVPVASVARMVKQHGISPEKIKKIVVHSNHDAFMKCSGENKRRPVSVPDFQFSMYVTVALGVLKGGITLADIGSQTWGDKRVLALADKVETKVDPELEKLPVLIPPNLIEIEMVSGEHYQERAEHVIGSPQQRMSRKEVGDKFHGCIGYSLEKIARNKAEQFVEMSWNLDQVEDIRPMVDLLVAEKQSKMERQPVRAI